MADETSGSRRERVLVVDDARDIREFLTEYILEPNGYEVLTAADGLEGLQLAFSERPDLLIVDFMMPNMNGLDLLQRLHTRRVHIPSILMTAHGSEQVAVQALRLGVRDYVIKPFVVKEMQESIDRAMHEHRLQGERDELNQRLQVAEARLRQHGQELNAIYSIVKSASYSLHLDTVLGRVVEAAVYLAGADQGSLLLSDERGNLYLRASKRSDSKVRILRERIHDSEAQRVMESKQTTILGGDHYPLHSATAHKAFAVAYVPLIRNGESIGVLAVANYKRGRTFSKQATRILTALGGSAAAVISNARLTDQLQAERVQLNSIISQIHNPVLVIDHKYRIRIFNEPARAALRLPGGNLNGRPLSQLLGNQELLAFITQPPDTGLVRHADVILDSGARFTATLTPIKEIGRTVVMHPHEIPISGRN
jgi:two-component system NtrC family sensor kinase